MTGFTSPWSQNKASDSLRFDDINPFLDWHQATPAGQVYHRVSWKIDESASYPAVVSICMRLLSHIILSRLPDEAMVGTLEDLVRKYTEFSTEGAQLSFGPNPQVDARSARLLRSIIGARISAVRSPRRSDDPEDALLP